MATYEAQGGVDSDWLFPGVRGGSFTVETADSFTFSIRYAADGNPGQGLVVTFVSTGGNFTYNGTVPTGGLFDEIRLSSVGGPIPLPLASWTDLTATSLTSFSEANLAQSLLGSNADSLTGGGGDDVLNGRGSFGVVDTYVGGAGDDTFVLGPSSGGSIVHGANADGTGGNNETDTIKLVFSSSVDTSEISNIDAIVFATPDSIFALPFVVRGTDIGGLSETLAITGDDNGSTIEFRPVDSSTAVDFNLSGFTFANWTSGNVLILGSSTGDTVIGSRVDDRIFAVDGPDILRGGLGRDEISAGDGADIIRIAGSEGLGDSFDGGADIDTLQVLGSSVARLSAFNAGASSIEIWDGNGEEVLGTSGANVFNFAALTAKTGLAFVDGLGGNDRITGSKFADSLRGGSGNDIVKGGLGKDLVTGGKGKDSLFGGAEADRFDFNSISESKNGSANRDTIQDFKRGQDDIDLKTIDAKSGVAGNDAFKFIGKQDFHGEKGELRFTDLGSRSLVQGDVNGDGTADFEIMVKVGTLSAGDFLL